jgi:hypothetical protein
VLDLNDFGDYLRRLYVLRASDLSIAAALLAVRLAFVSAVAMLVLLRIPGRPSMFVVNVLGRDIQSLSASA